VSSIETSTPQISPLSYKDYQLDPFQTNAIRSIQMGNSLLVSAPTGSGKTVIAEYAVQRSLELGKRVIYTAPIKALSNQKFRDFSKQYPNQVGILTGDVSIFPEAPIVLMTTEIFRNAIFEDQRRLEKVHYVIFDEIHFINDAERGTVWEESIIFTPPHIQIVCLSATVPNSMELAEWIASVRQCPLDVIEEQKRSVPLLHQLYTKQGLLPITALNRPLPRFSKKKTKFYIIDYVVEQNHLPALIFCFNRKACERKAYHRMGDTPLTTPEEAEQIRQWIADFLQKADLVSLQEVPLMDLLTKGIGYHHAGMLPFLKEVVERLFSTGWIKLLFTTETFAMGINMPACSVIFTELKRWTSHGLELIQAGSYHQMAGRAGRRGMDKQGYVYAPLGTEPKIYPDIYKLITGDIEPISSQFNLSYSTVINLYSRLKEGLMEACDKSLGIYLKTKNQPPDFQEEVREIQRREVRKKLKLLRHLAYIDDRILLNRGLFAAKLSGYELFLTEFHFAGLFEPLSKRELVVLITAIVFEGKRSDWYLENSYEERDFAKKANTLVEKTRNLEILYQIQPINSLDFRLSAAVEAWVEGCPFQDLSQYTSCSEGDFVRTIRMTLQLVKQLFYALVDYKAFRERLHECILALNRDHIDAKKQLTLDN
jgi:superfamily II RNA helicase